MNAKSGISANDHSDTKCDDENVGVISSNHTETAKFLSNEWITKEVEKSARRISKFVRKTPLEFSSYLSAKTGATVYLKLESEQVAGSFKSRGAFNKVLKLSEGPDPGEKNRKLFTASSGNHGIAMTMALKATGRQGVVYVPKFCPKAKQKELRLQKAEIKIFGDDFFDTEEKAKKAAEEEDGIFVSAYNDPDIIVAAGTIMPEVLQDCHDVDAVFITAGGGALAGGISAYAKQLRPNITIIGASAEASNALEQSVKAGKVVQIINQNTLSDGASGNIIVPSLTFPICQRNVDLWISVNEQEIADSMYLMLNNHHKVIEGAAALPLAAFLKVQDQFTGKKVVIIISGSSVGPEVLQSIIGPRLSLEIS